MNARQAAATAIDVAKVPLRIAGKALGIGGALAVIALDLARDQLAQRAEAKRIRIIDRRRKT
jgi:hypothetical protein